MRDKLGRDLNFDRQASWAASMEDCIAADLGIFHDKDFVNIKASEYTVRNQFEKEPFNCFFSRTNDGYQIGVKGSDVHGENCLVYVSFLRVMSFDFNKEASDEIEMWHFVNECLISYFFK